MDEEEQAEPSTHFERLDDLLSELSKYGHAEFWYKETNIGVSGTPGERILRRILTRDNRDIARWGCNGRRWDFLPAYSVPNKDVNCIPPVGAEFIDPVKSQEIEFEANMSDVHKS